MVTDAGIPGTTWLVRRNVRHKFWYEHRSTGFRTHVRPMTAVCPLPTGWVAVRDTSGNILYRNPSGQLFHQHPNGLPSGWREAKDPDGKVFFVHDAMQLASWHRPGEQPKPSVQAAPVVGQAAVVQKPTHSPRPSINGSLPMQAGMRPNSAVIKPMPNVQVIPARKPSQPVTLATATEATINLIDPTHGSVMRGTKIAAHMTGQGMVGTVNAIKRNKPLQDFAKGTGIALANKKIKKAWRKAGKEIDAMGKRQEVVVTQNSAHGQVFEETDSNYAGEYVAEYEDGTVVVFSSDGKPLRVVARPQLSTGAASGVLTSQQQRPEVVRVATNGIVAASQRPVVNRAATAQLPIRRPIPQAQPIPSASVQQIQLQHQQQQIQAQRQQQELLIQQQRLQQAAIQQAIATNQQSVSQQQMFTQHAYAQANRLVDVTSATYVDQSQVNVVCQSPDASASQDRNIVVNQIQGLLVDQSQDSPVAQFQSLSLDQDQSTIIDQNTISTTQGQATFVDQTNMAMASPPQQFCVDQGTAASVTQNQDLWMDQTTVTTSGEPQSFIVEQPDAGFAQAASAYVDQTSSQQDSWAAQDIYVEENATVAADQTLTEQTVVEYEEVSVVEVQEDMSENYEVTDVEYASVDMESTLAVGDSFDC